MRRSAQHHGENWLITYPYRFFAAVRFRAVFTCLWMRSNRIGLQSIGAVEACGPLRRAVPPSKVLVRARHLVCTGTVLRRREPGNSNVLRGMSCAIEFSLCKSQNCIVR